MEEGQTPGPFWCINHSVNANVLVVRQAVSQSKECSSCHCLRLSVISEDQTASVTLRSANAGVVSTQLYTHGADHQEFALLTNHFMQNYGLDVTFISEKDSP